MLLHDKLKNYHVILASGSPRRRQLIADCGIEYSLAEGYQVEELYPNSLCATDVPQYLSELKSNGYPFQLKEKEILITADTVVILKGKALGKPADRAEAIEMINELGGTSHRVVTGVTLRNNKRMHTFSASTVVWMRKLTHQEIEYYVDTYKPFDKAGAYGIQEWIGYTAIERIEGSFYNVMGLPVQMLYTNLNKFIAE